MSRKIWIILIVICIIGLALAFYFYEKKSEEEGFLTLYGNVDVRQVDLGFRVSGRVEKMHFEEGDYVNPGDLMGSLELQPYVDLVRQAQAAVDAARPLFMNAEKVLKRRLELVGQGGVSKEDLDNAQSNFENQAANLQQAEASLGVAKKNLEDTLVFAPTAGTILTRVREPGTVVNVGDPIYTLSVTSPVWIRAFVHEPDLGLLYPGMRAIVSTDTPGSPEYEGHVGFISPVSEFTPKTVETTRLRTDLVYRLRVYVDNIDQGLRQGMPVTVKLQIQPEQNKVKK